MKVELYRIVLMIDDRISPGKISIMYKSLTKCFNPCLNLHSPYLTHKYPSLANSDKALPRYKPNIPSGGACSFSFLESPLLSFLRAKDL